MSETSESKILEFSVQLAQTLIWSCTRILPKTFSVLLRDFAVINSFQKWKKPVSISTWNGGIRPELNYSTKWVWHWPTLARIASAALEIILYRRMSTNKRRRCFLTYSFLSFSIVLMWILCILTVAKSVKIGKTWWFPLFVEQYSFIEELTVMLMPLSIY